MIFRRLLPVSLALAALPASATIGLVVGEPFGSFGTMMPVGHAGIYLDHVCADTPSHLRPCNPGEPGVILSRYHDLRHPGLDWMAIPAPVFLYGVDDPVKAPTYITASLESELRESYRQAHLLTVAPDRIHHGQAVPPPYGDWEEGIGAAFDRRLFLYTLDSTPEQDAAIITLLNDTPNHRRYTLRRANCADFAADILQLTFPDLPRRSILADFDLTTPKGLARQLSTFAQTHPELHPAVYEVPQIPGTPRRSRPLRGSAETFVKTKRYLATLILIQPEAILADWIIYETKGRWNPTQNATVLTPTQITTTLSASSTRRTLAEGWAAGNFEATTKPSPRTSSSTEWTAATLYPLTPYSPASTFSNTASPPKGFLAK